MSWSVSEILKPFEKLVVVYYQAENFLASSRVFKPDNKGLEVTIKAKIEQELAQVAVGKQSKPLKVVKPATVGGKNNQTKKKGGGKKKK